MPKSKTLVKNQARRKTNTELVETIYLANKNPKWHKVAELLSVPRRRKISVNLEKIDQATKEGDTIIVPGKVLSLGDVTKKIRLAAMSFSSEAEKKLKQKKSEIVKIKQEIKINPRAEGIKIIK